MNNHFIHPTVYIAIKGLYTLSLRWTVLPVKWVLRDQAMGTQGPSGGHQQTKRWAFIARAVCIECPKVGRFLGTLWFNDFS